MEVIEIPGYTEEEKLGIAQKIPDSRDSSNEHGITEKHVKIVEAAIRQIIIHYTREAGVRNLEREIANVMRKVAKKVAEGKGQGFPINAGNLHKYLGVPKFVPEAELEKDEIGVATGLAWTEAGGDVLYIEATVMKGKGATDPDRSSRRRHEGIGAGGLELCPFARENSRHQPRHVHQAGPAHPCAGRRHSQRRSLRRHHDGHRHRLGAGAGAGAPGSGDDRRNHIARTRAADRRIEGKNSCRKTRED